MFTRFAIKMIISLGFLGITGKCICTMYLLCNLGMAARKRFAWQVFHINMKSLPCVFPTLSSRAPVWVCVRHQNANPQRVQRMFDSQAFLCAEKYLVEKYLLLSSPSPSPSPSRHETWAAKIKKTNYVPYIRLFNVQCSSCVVCHSHRYYCTQFTCDTFSTCCESNLIKS